MNKSELVQQLASRADLSRAEATRAVNSLFDAKEGIISKAIKAGQKVTIAGVGSFEPRQRTPRTPARASRSRSGAAARDRKP